MYDFILQNIIVLGLAIVIYLLARALPRVSSEDESAVPKKPGRIDVFIKRLPLAKIDAAVSAFLEKILRRARVLNLKIENSINSGIGRLRKGNEAKAEDKNQQDLFEK